MKRKHTIILATIAMVILFGGGFAFSQEKASDNMQIVIEKVRADKKLLVAENMQLTEAEGKAFWPVYDQYQNELFLLPCQNCKIDHGLCERSGKDDQRECQDTP